MAKIQYSAAEVIFWDLGGQQRMRCIWDKYYADASAIIFVVDSADNDRLEDARSVYGMIMYICVTILHIIYVYYVEGICSHELNTHIPVFIYANKQDIPVSTVYSLHSSHLIYIIFA